MRVPSQTTELKVYGGVSWGGGGSLWGGSISSEDVILLCDWFRSDAGCENRIVKRKKLLKQVTPSGRQHTMTNNE